MSLRGMTWRHEDKLPSLYEEIAAKAKIKIVREKELTQTDIKKINSYKPRDRWESWQLQRYATKTKHNL